MAVVNRRQLPLAGTPPGYSPSANVRYVDAAANEDSILIRQSQVCATRPDALDGVRGRDRCDGAAVTMAARAAVR